MVKIAGRRRKQLTVGALGALIALALIAAASPPSPTPVVVGGQFSQFTFQSSFSPRVLSSTEPTPVELRLSAEFSAPDGSGGPPPAARELLIETDPNLVIDTKGLPACNPTLQIQRQAAGPGGVRERCKPALVGHGSADLWIAYPEAKAMRPRVEMWLYNGGTRGGITKLFAYAEVGSPLNGALTAKIKIKKIREHHYGAEATVSIPKIAGGYGSIGSFDVTIGQDYTYKRQSRSVVTLKCPHDEALFTKAEARFADGGTEGSEMARPCIRR